MKRAIVVPDEVRESFTGELIDPADPAYEQARRVHNGLVDKRPALIARCRTVPDVVDALTVGREQAAEISVRGGGHNVAGKAVTEGGLMIDLSLMRGIRVDPRHQTVWAQGGSTWKEFNRAAACHGLATTGLSIMPYLGAVTRVDPTATAFPHRSPGYSLLIVSQWQDPAETEANIGWAAETFEALRPYMSGRRYVNNLSADDGRMVRDIWGINYERLVRIKRRYDPDNVFRLNHNINPAG